MRVSGHSPSYQSAEADAAERLMLVLKKQQEVVQDEGQALVALIDGASSSEVGRRINVYA